MIPHTGPEDRATLESNPSAGLVTVARVGLGQALIYPPGLGLAA